ncbi:7128_t:CDS:1, partial [Scutellospora calospora]
CSELGYYAFDCLFKRPQDENPKYQIMKCPDNKNKEQNHNINLIDIENEDD